MDRHNDNDSAPAEFPYAAATIPLSDRCLGFIRSDTLILGKVAIYNPQLLNCSGDPVAAMRWNKAVRLLDDNLLHNKSDP